MDTFCRLSQTETSKRPTADKVCSDCVWSDRLGRLVGYNNFEKESQIIEGMHLETIKTSKDLADALNRYSDKFFGRLKGLKFLPGEDISYIPFNYNFMVPMKNIRRHQNFAYMKVEDEYLTIRFLWDEKV